MDNYRTNKNNFLQYLSLLYFLFNYSFQTKSKKHTLNTEGIKDYLKGGESFLFFRFERNYDILHRVSKISKLLVTMFQEPSSCPNLNNRETKRWIALSIRAFTSPLGPAIRRHSVHLFKRGSNDFKNYETRTAPTRVSSWSSQ